MPRRVWPSFETPALQAPNTKVKTKFRLRGEMEKILSSAVGRPRRWSTQDEVHKKGFAHPGYGPSNLNETLPGKIAFSEN